MAEGGSGPSYTHTRAAFDRAKVSEMPLEGRRTPQEQQHILRNIKRHKHVPILAPKGSLRVAPDRRVFLYYEALDRAEAIQRRKARSQQHSPTRQEQPGYER